MPFFDTFPLKLLLLFDCDFPLLQLHGFIGEDSKRILVLHQAYRAPLSFETYLALAPWGAADLGAGALVVSDWARKLPEMAVYCLELENE